MWSTCRGRHHAASHKIATSERQLTRCQAQRKKVPRGSAAVSNAKLATIRGSMGWCQCRKRHSTRTPRTLRRPKRVQKWLLEFMVSRGSGGVTTVENGRPTRILPEQVDFSRMVAREAVTIVLDILGGKTSETEGSVVASESGMSGYFPFWSCAFCSLLQHFKGSPIRKGRNRTERAVIGEQQ